MKKVILYYIPLTFLMACGKNEKTIHPELKELTEAVYASGNVFPEMEYKVYANADGILQDIFVTEGDTVNAGQVILKIVSDLQNAKASTARAVYSKTVENFGVNSPALNEAEAVLNSAKNKLTNDSLNFVRYKNLMDKNATSQVEFERAKLNFTNSQNDYSAKKNSLRRIKNQLFIEMENAENVFKAGETDLSNFSVKSVLNGMIFEIYKKKGEAVRRGEPIALIGSRGKVYAKLVIDELDVARVKTGQNVLIKLDFNKSKIYEAKVSKIYPKLNKEDQSFRVDAEFTNEQPPLLYGLTVEANIVISSRNNVLTIPKTAITEGDSVMIKSNESNKKIKIERGAENMELTEVIKGLDKNSEIIVKTK